MCIRDRPYIYHPLRVMLYANGDENVKCAAVLHDVIEDTKITEHELAEIGFGKDILVALRLLTRQPDDDYMDYIQRLKHNPTAKAVKLADLKDNMDCLLYTSSYKRRRQRPRAS